MEAQEEVLSLDLAGLLGADDHAHTVAQDLGGAAVGSQGQDDSFGSGSVGRGGLTARDDVGDVAGDDPGMGPSGVGALGLAHVVMSPMAQTPGWSTTRRYS